MVSKIDDRIRKVPGGLIQTGKNRFGKISQPFAVHGGRQSAVNKCHAADPHGTWLNASHTSTRPPAHPSVIRRIVASWRGCQAKAIQHRIKTGRFHRLKTPGPHCPAQPVPGGCASDSSCSSGVSRETSTRQLGGVKWHREASGSAPGFLHCRKAGRARPSPIRTGSRAMTSSRKARRPIRQCGPNRLPVPRAMAGFFKKEETSWLGRDAFRA
jgi:hypothetical protein